MFAAPSDTVTNRLFDLFIYAEDAYFQNLKKYDPYNADISLEPLVSDKPGDPVYVLNTHPYLLFGNLPPVSVHYHLK